MDENSKNAISISIIVAAITATIAQFVLCGAPWGREAMFDFSYAKLFMNMGIGLAVGGATFGVLKAMGK